ncbi:MAG: DUF1254 domain-containing protein [Alphaproteobacteria bacterium]
MSNLLRWITGTLALAAVVHFAVIIAYPRIAMNRLMDQIEDRAGGPNRAVYPPRPDHESRRVVRPSPDLFYAICVFDAGDGPVHVRAPAADSYWSVSFYGAGTGNFYVIGRAPAGKEQVDVVLAKQGTDVTEIPYPVLTPPTSRGVALYRVLIDREERLTALDRLRKRMECRPLGG